jgi:hypothetical protein
VTDYNTHNPNTSNPLSFAIGDVAHASNLLDFQGLIDEVRLSDTVLSEEELLISQIPEPSVFSLLATGIVALAVARRRGRART